MSPPSLLGPPQLQTQPQTQTQTQNPSSSDPFIDLVVSNFNTPPSPSPPPQMGFTENNSTTFLQTGNPCLDLFFQVLPDTPSDSLINRVVVVITIKGVVLMVREVVEESDDDAPLFLLSFCIFCLIFNFILFLFGCELCKLKEDFEGKWWVEE
ncbi:hypothetical protein RND81_11G124000 [Saponaria officinalis]|uniref:Uncharacterized protein n=1 Tax=Saponaria officinalis TaxID=3572 RepID=A0AAW1HLA5_SAPOF